MSREAFEKWKKDKGVHYNAAQAWQAAWGEQQKRIDELDQRATGLAMDQMETAKLNAKLQAQIESLKDQFADMKEYFGMQEYLYQGDSYNRGWNSALVLIKEHLAKVLKGGDE